jgi:predicted nucleotidyltransferase
MNFVTITLESLHARRDELLEIARRRGATAVWVIGSIARGDPTLSSDIDFLVAFEPGLTVRPGPPHRRAW